MVLMVSGVTVGSDDARPRASCIPKYTRVLSCTGREGQSLSRTGFKKQENDNPAPTTVKLPNETHHDDEARPVCAHEVCPKLRYERSPDQDIDADN
jgi:hypothetical protein